MIPYKSLEEVQKYREDGIKKIINCCSPALGIVYKNGILLAAQNPSFSFKKIIEVHERLAIVGVGEFNYFKKMADTAINMADMQGFNYSPRDINVKSIVLGLAENLNQCFMNLDAVPLIVNLLIAEVDYHCKKTIYSLSYNGGIIDVFDFIAIGGKEEIIRSFLKTQYNPGIDLKSALNMAIKAIASTLEKNQEAITEFAIIDHTLTVTNKFKILTGAEVEKTIKEE